MDEISLQTDLFENPKDPSPILDLTTDSVQAWLQRLEQEHNIRIEFPNRLKKSIRLQQSGKMLVIRSPKSVIHKQKDLELLSEWGKVLQSRYLFRKRVKREKLKGIEAAVRELINRPAPGSKHDEKSPAQYPKLHLSSIQPQGKHYDLRKILRIVQQKHLPEMDSNLLKNIFISWSKGNGGRSYHTLRRGEGDSLVHFISISRGYDAKNCPIEALIGVVLHECLHIIIPPKKGSGQKRIVHGKEFRIREEKYLHYKAWVTWHHNILPLNIRKMKRSRKKGHPL